MKRTVKVRVHSAIFYETLCGPMQEMTRSGATVAGVSCVFFNKSQGAFCFCLKGPRTFYHLGIPLLPVCC